MPKTIQNVYDAPAYTGPQASHYVGIPYQTLRGWTGPRGLITTPKPNALSFNNLAEAHILKAMRRTHKLSLQRIRKALLELSNIRRTAHPLLDETFATDGIDLCIFEEESVINLNKQQQTEIKEFVTLYMKRIERDATGRAAKLYPFISRDSADEPKHISISPTISFGRPVLTGTGISTAVIAGRFAARDSISELAAEYEVKPDILEDAIRWEMLKGRAA